MPPSMDNSSPKKKRRLRLLLLLFLGAVLIGGALAYRQFWLVRPIGKGPAGPAVPHSSFSEIWTTRKVFCLVLGIASPPVLVRQRATPISPA